MTTSEHNSYHSSPRSPSSIYQDKVSSPSEYSNSPNSPPKYGRRLLIQELLTSDQGSTEGSILEKTSPLPNLSLKSSQEIMNSTHFLSNLKQPGTNNNHYNNINNNNNNLSVIGIPSPTISNFPGQHPQSEFSSRQSQSPPPNIPYVYSPTASSGGFDDASNDPLNTLSVAERRERNKVASAKYRAKKHKQTQEMGSQIQNLNSKISVLMAENGMLERQMQELKDENAQLKATIEEMKMKLVEDNILKRLGKRGVKGSMKVNSSTTLKRKHGGSGHAKGTMANSVNSP